jgi:hypothetical protein
MLLVRGSLFRIGVCWGFRLTLKECQLLPNLCALGIQRGLVSRLLVTMTHVNLQLNRCYGGTLHTWLLLNILLCTQPAFPASKDIVVLNTHGDVSQINRAYCPAFISYGGSQVAARPYLASRLAMRDEVYRHTQAILGGPLCLHRLNIYQWKPAILVSLAVPLKCFKSSRSTFY